MTKMKKNVLIIETTNGQKILVENSIDDIYKKRLNDKDHQFLEFNMIEFIKPNLITMDKLRYINKNPSKLTANVSPLIINKNQITKIMPFSITSTKLNNLQNMSVEDQFNTKIYVPVINYLVKYYNVLNLS